MTETIYKLPDSNLIKIKDSLENIINPKVYYTKNKIEFYQNVIAEMRKEAKNIKELLPKRFNEL